MSENSERRDLPAELQLLSELKRGEIISQQELSKRISVSVGFLNALIKRAVKKGMRGLDRKPTRMLIYVGSVSKPSCQ